MCALAFSVAHAQESKSNSDALAELASEFTQANSSLVAERFIQGEELFFSSNMVNVDIGAITAVAKNKDIYLNFDDYIAVLDLPISYDLAAQSYNGWFIEEQNTFELNLFDSTQTDGSLVAIVDNDRIVISQDEFTYIDDQLYINEKTLGSIFTLEHKFNYQKLELEFIPLGKFPLLDKLQRQNRTSRRTGNQQPSYINLPRGYEILSPQILDFQLNSIYREQNKELDSFLSLQGARDVALLHTQFSLSASDKNGFTSGRLNFSRQSPEGELFGNTGITKFEFGDVRNVRQGTGSTLAESLGFRLQNDAIGNRFDSEFINIEGDVPAGWDVELYRNGVLLSQQFNVNTGRYEFVDTPLIYGQNSFEVVLYGPQGQVRKRNINRLVDEKTSSDRPATYQVSLTKLNKTVLGLENDIFQQDLGYNFSSRVRTFIDDGFSLNFGLQSTFGGVLDSTNTNVGLSKVVFDDTLFDLNLGYNELGGVPINTSLRGNALGQSIALSYSNIDVSSKVENPSEQFSLSVEGPIKLSEKFSIPLSQTLIFSKANQREILTYSNAVGVNIGRVSMFHNLNFEKSTVDGVESDRVSGSLNFQSNFGRVFTRLSGNYSPDSDKTFDNARVNINWNPFNKLNFTFSGTKNFLDDSFFTNVSAGYLGENYRINARLGYSDLNGYDIGLNASFSLSGHTAEYQTISESAFSNTRVGAIAVRVFFDKNLNAVFDEGDTPLPNVVVEASQFHKKQTSDINGIAVIERLANNSSSDILIDRNSLPEPFLVPLAEGVSITARAGLVDHLDYPIVISSEIDGIVELESNGELESLARAKINLIDDKGRVVKQALSEYDGYYAFAGVIPGNYRIVISEIDMIKFDVVSPEVAIVGVPTTPEFITQDLRYKKRPYQQGFISQIGRFSDNKLARLFLISLKQKQPQLSVYIENDKRNKSYRVFTDFTSNEEKAQQACASLNDISIQCEVVNFKLPEIRS
jgi:hypothetical protein